MQADRYADMLHRLIDHSTVGEVNIARSLHWESLGEKMCELGSGRDTPRGIAETVCR